MDQPEVSVRAWNSYNHWDKSRGGLNIQVKSGEQVRKERIRKFAALTTLGFIVAVVVTAIIISVVLYNLPEEVVVTQGTYQLSINFSHFQ